MYEAYRPAWVEVNTNHMAHNIQEVKRLIRPGTRICAVIKADGYKLGVIKSAEIYLANGADMFSVAILDEALEIRKEFRNIEILVLGYTPVELFEQAIIEDIILTIYDVNHGIRLNQVAEKLGKTAKVHLKLETGMNRLGFLPNDKSVKEIESMYQLPNLMIEGIFTHLARADEIDKTWSYKQKDAFDDFYNRLMDIDVKIPIRHVSNSAAIIDLPDFNYEMVRPGIMLTGLYPSDEVNKNNADLKLAFKLKANLAFVKPIKKGDGVSYGHQFIADSDMIVGTVPIGYADGFTRMLSGKMSVSVKGISCKVLGRICMDQFVIDLSDVSDAAIGDEVILYGDGSESEKTPDQIGKLLGTINYEIITMLDRRLPRIYQTNGEISGIKNYLL
ncbi:MAG: Alanine racemase [Clostridiales bacterium 38_11]|nr:MAG: Alanine racemase [Clostridiales bacterium 38_11]HBH11511.1 alanine racemase [Clostridiales bacterium]